MLQATYVVVVRTFRKLGFGQIVPTITFRQAKEAITLVIPQRGNRKNQCETSYITKIGRDGNFVF